MMIYLKMKSKSGSQIITYCKAGTGTILFIFLILLVQIISCTVGNVLLKDQRLYENEIKLERQIRIRRDNEVNSVGKEETEIKNETINLPSPSSTTSPRDKSTIYSGQVIVQPYGPLPPLKKSTEAPTNDSLSSEGAGHKKGSKSDRQFDRQALQRSFMVGGLILTIIFIYLGIKYVCKRKKRTGIDKRYGRLETSEMDMLETIDEDDDDQEMLSEDDTLFELHSANSNNTSIQKI